LSFGPDFGNSPVSAHVAQLAEHVLGKDEVIGSIPIMGSIDLKNSLTETK
jgi:hypothetical protein